MLVTIFYFVTKSNHEFDFGPKAIQERIQESKFTWLCANIFEPDEQTVFRGMMPQYIRDIKGIKFGLFGAVTEEVSSLSHPGNTVFKNVIETSKKAVEFLKQKGAQIIIALTHQYLPQDIELAKEVSEIDLILGGHDHTPCTIFEGTTMIHKSGMDAHWLGRIDISIEYVEDEEKNSRRVLDFEWKMIQNKNFKEDIETSQIIDKFSEKLNSLKTHRLCVFDTPIDSLTGHIRKQESTFGNLVTDICRHAFYGADVCIIQGGFIYMTHFVTVVQLSHLYFYFST